MAIELDRQNDKFVQDLLYLSQSSCFIHCNCAGKSQIEELAGWPVLNRCGKGDKVTPSPVNSRSKSKPSKKIGPLTNDNAIHGKGGGPRKGQDHLISRPTCSEPSPEVETKLLDLQSHKEHAIFYTQQYSSTKSAALKPCVDQPYDLRPGDTSRRGEIQEKKNWHFARPRFPLVKPSDASFTCSKTDGSSVRIFAHEDGSDFKSKTSFGSRANSVSCTPCHMKKDDSLNLSRVYQSAPNCRGPCSKRDHRLEISTFRLSKADLPRNKACRTSERWTRDKGVVGSRMLGRTSSSFSDTRSYKRELSLLGHRATSKVVLSYHHS